MSLHAYEISFPDFCQMAYLKISYGELKGVFVKEPDTVIMDVYLHNEMGLANQWQGQIYVVKGDLMAALEGLHRNRVLARYRELREQSKHSGHSLAGHSILFLARHYRTVSVDELYDGIDKALAGLPRIYGSSPVMFEAYAFAAWGDVRVCICPHMRTLHLTHEDGETQETLELTNLHRDTVLAAIVPFLAEQNIRTVGLKAVQKAA